MRRTPILWVALLVTGAGIAYCEKAGSQFADDQYIQDSKIKEKVLGVANEYVRKQLKDIGYLVAKDTSANAERRFSVVQVWDVVSRKDAVYTVQIDTDEIGGEPRYVLFLDLKEADGEFKVFGTRIGPRHLRQSSQ